MDTDLIARLYPADGRGDGALAFYAIEQVAENRSRPGISFHHCALTFEEDFDDCRQYRPVLRDLGSTYGTAVTYDDNKRHRRRNFRWILGGHEVLNGIEQIVIEIH
ncbi:hypothetical protein BDY21DRAFT_362952 [Lineolata rhizophorae]|uniref:FHA domain-containing protein n=1 Tax=Lineolata rhizophorae TaxID=578093 RepID=A0A6A6P4I6_9PEZI|nr:hypothetical protein BDY21DRAFT_362952 [Lineolata rhizophorae]